MTGPVIFDCLVEKHENCFPMIPSGKAHNEMLLGEAGRRRAGVSRAGDRAGALVAVLIWLAIVWTILAGSGDLSMEMTSASSGVRHGCSSAC
jgi:hypothetical protein